MPERMIKYNLRTVTVFFFKDSSQITDLDSNPYKESKEQFKHQALHIGQSLLEKTAVF